MTHTARRVPPLLALAAHLGHGIARVTTDAALRGVRTFPRRIADLDTDTLTGILGRRVTSVTVLDGTAGTTSRARVALTGAGVPASVFIKMSAGAAGTRLIGELGRLAETEVRFYRDLAPQLTGVPRAFGSAFDALTGRFVLVLEDLAAGPCEFPDTVHPLDADHAGRVVELLAGLHAAFWGRLPAVGGGGPLGWLYSGSGDPSVPLVPALLRRSARRLADRPGVEDGRFIIEHYPAVARLIDAPPHTVLHGDAHPGNCYFRDGAAGLLDWQAVRRGHPARDLAYTLITSMTTAERRASERELVGTYRAALVAAGGPELDRGQLWERYRQAAAYAYVAALATAGLGGMQAENIALEGLQRSVAALGDLDTVARLQQAL
ncbi:phosphotransferase [Mycobacterium talmoniae]|uniref:Phosphotransferase n=1 Tax=Mycobacterium talmoniae TaxID=1858794 RepID=A0A1S1NQS2_9MYCO|nr:phosphotransferase [Mycobacterium talmoniae]OHV06750.1 phosphotransferase [Mycobacterium talmoniae]